MPSIQVTHLLGLVASQCTMPTVEPSKLTCTSVKSRLVSRMISPVSRVLVAPTVTRELVTARFVAAVFWEAKASNT